MCLKRCIYAAVVLVGLCKWKPALLAVWSRDLPWQPVRVISYALGEVQVQSGSAENSLLLQNSVASFAVTLNLSSGSKDQEGSGRVLCPPGMKHLEDYKGNTT